MEVRRGLEVGYVPTTSRKGGLQREGHRETFSYLDPGCSWLPLQFISSFYYTQSHLLNLIPMIIEQKETTPKGAQQPEKEE